MSVGKRRIGIVGASQATQEGLRLARQVGRLIAEREALLICGGLGGVMEAASRGCVEAGGEVVGILPGATAEAVNPYVTIPIATNVGHGRNIIIAHTAEVLIAIEGEYGTLSEMAIALKLGKGVVQLNCLFQLAAAVVARNPEDAVQQAMNLI